MKIFLAILLTMGISLPALSQTSSRDQKTTYAQTRCKELLDAKLLGDNKQNGNWLGCMESFKERFDERSMNSNNFLSEENNNLQLRIEICKDVDQSWHYFDRYWFRSIEDINGKNAYNDCLVFYKIKKVTNSGNPAIIPDNVDDALDQLLEQKMLEMGN